MNNLPDILLWGSVSSQHWGKTQRVKQPQLSITTTMMNHLDQVSPRLMASVSYTKSFLAKATFPVYMYSGLFNLIPHSKMLHGSTMLFLELLKQLHFDKFISFHNQRLVDRTVLTFTSNIIS